MNRQYALNIFKTILSILYPIVLLNACSNNQGDDSKLAEFNKTFLSKFTPMPSDSVLIYNSIFQYTDTIFYGGKLLSPEEIKLIPKENKDSVTPDSGRFLATYRIDIDSLCTALIINHPDRTHKREFYMYMYYKKLNLMTSQCYFISLEPIPDTRKHLIIKRNKSGIPESLSIRNTHYSDHDKPDSASSWFDINYKWFNQIDIYKGF